MVVRQHTRWRNIGAAAIAVPTAAGAHVLGEGNMHKDPLSIETQAEEDANSLASVFLEARLTKCPCSLYDL